MRKTFTIIYLGFSIFFMAGCLQTLNPFYKSPEEKKIEAKEEKRQVDQDLGERSKELTSAVKDVADYAVAKKETAGEIPSHEMRLILMLSKEDERIEGQPIERLDIQFLLSDLDQARILIDKYKEQHTKMLKQRQNLDIRIVSLNAQLQAEKENWLGNMWGWFTGLGFMSLVGLGVMVIFFPTLGLPILQWVIGWITGTFPKLISFMGVVGKDVVDSVIKGHEEIKKVMNDSDIFEKNLNRYEEGKTFTKAEVREYLNELKRDIMQNMKTKMRENADSKNRVHKIVHQRKADLGI